MSFAERKRRENGKKNRKGIENFHKLKLNFQISHVFEIDHSAIRLIYFFKALNDYSYCFFESDFVSFFSFFFKRSINCSYILNYI